MRGTAAALSQACCGIRSAACKTLSCPWPAMSCLAAAWLLLFRSAALFPNHGRIVVTQFSIGVGIPLTMFLLKARMCGCPCFFVLCYALLLYNSSHVSRDSHTIELTVLQGLPFKPRDDVAAANALVLTVTGLLISWAAPACEPCRPTLYCVCFEV